MHRAAFGLTLTAAAMIATFAVAQSQGSPSQPAQQIPVMDGGAGPCSLLLTVRAPDTKPVLAANVKVHIAYGFAGIRKLDLEAYTNADGKLKFTGIPSKVKDPPLQFQATKDQLTGVATYNPATECEAQHDLPLTPQKSAQ
jgi:hypothetical protein